jgi:hypothetical protein
MGQEGSLAMYKSPPLVPVLSYIQPTQTFPLQIPNIHYNIIIIGVSGQHHAPAALYPLGKGPRYPLDRRLGGPQSRSGHRG